eukprot:TRINITY_DN7363_c0_g1_i3.p1 TRINITY_DN7363_c0_g1~~TRINITY_DN7363_c0_g1_i3.p1  ORF type:complete len:129 (-),score=20.70 TRINITY_DN7363_c0_g1_i3:201-587(-)
MDWVEMYPLAPLTTGTTIVLSAYQFGMWSLSACRVVYVHEEEILETRKTIFSFAYGTLPSHVISGECKFSVEWDHNTDLVTYKILSFSHPCHWLTILGTPLCRWTQSTFDAASAEVMKRAVAAKTTRL